MEGVAGCSPPNNMVEVHPTFDTAFFIYFYKIVNANGDMCERTRCMRPLRSCDVIRGSVGVVDTMVFKR